MIETIAVSGIWLRTAGKDRLEVLAEIDGKWRLVIDEYCPRSECEIGHIVEPSGMKKSPIDPLDTKK